MQDTVHTTDAAKNWVVQGIGFTTNDVIEVSFQPDEKKIVWTKMSVRGASIIGQEAAHVRDRRDWAEGVPRLCGCKDAELRSVVFKGRRMMGVLID